MKRLIFVFIFTTALLPLFAVATPVVLIVMNRKDSKGVEDALCIVRQPGSKKELVAFTDANGQLKIPFAGLFEVQVKKLGYKMYQGPLQLQNETILLLDQENINLEDVVITGQYTATTSQSSVYTVQVIDRKKIDEMGANNLRDVLTNQLNVRIAQDNVLGASASIGGVSGQGIKILVDGIPVIGRMNGNIDLSQINLSNIEKIELVEGPMSVMYGSDAMGGVINLISKRKTKELFTLGLNSYYETNSTFNADGKVAFKIKNVQVSLSGGRNFFGGYQPGFNWQERTMQWKPRTQYFTDNSLTFKIKQTSHILFGNLLDETITNWGAPTVTPYSAYAFDEYYHTNRWRVGHQSDIYLPKNNQLQFINSFSFYRRTKNTYRKDLVKGESEITGTASDQDNSRFSLWMMRGVWTNTNIKKIQQQAGYDFNIETGSGDRIQGNRQTIQDYALFYTLQYNPVAKVSLKGGLRGAYNSRYGMPVVPSINIKYDITKTVSLRTSYAQGFRAPSLKELDMLFVDVNHNIQGNTSLKAERSHNVQMELVWQPEVKDYKFTLKPSVFFNHIYQMISLAMVDAPTQLYSYMNIDKFQSTGMSVNSSVTQKYFDFQLGFSYTGRYNSLSATTHTPHFTWAPEVSSSLTFNIPKINSALSAFYKFNGMIPGYALDENQQPYQTAIQSYSTLDATVMVKLWKERFVLSAGAKNILNVKNINYNVANTGAHSSSGNSMAVGMGLTGFASVKINLTNNFKP